VQRRGGPRTPQGVERVDREAGGDEVRAEAIDEHGSIQAFTHESWRLGG
jgi:hypothetical protein